MILTTMIYGLCVLTTQGLVAEGREQDAPNVFRIGDLGIVALPTEVFTEIGLEVENNSPFVETFTIELVKGATAICHH